MTDSKGLKCSRSYFYRLIRNPVYCGLIPINFDAEEPYLIKGIHDSLIPETLFYEVQRVITTKRKTSCKTEELKETFFLTGFLVCPLCNRKLYGSFSRGSTKRYPYYHCRSKCKTRINALLLNDCYQYQLEQLVLSNKAIDLFGIILDDWNTNAQKTTYLLERNMVMRKLNEQELILSQARKFFVTDIIKLDDYSELKCECLAHIGCLKKELNDITIKLGNIDKQSQLGQQPFENLLEGFSSLDTTDKKHFVHLIPPRKVNFRTGLSSWAWIMHC